MSSFAVHARAAWRWEGPQQAPPHALYASPHADLGQQVAPPASPYGEGHPQQLDHAVPAEGLPPVEGGVQQLPVVQDRGAERDALEQRDGTAQVVP